MPTAEDVFVTPVQRDQRFDFEDGNHPTRAHVWAGGPLTLDPTASHFIIVHGGKAQVEFDDSHFTLKAGYFGTFPGALSIDGEGTGLIVSSFGYRSMALMGGPLETEGRLRYVDNCQSTVLLSPPVKGEPCLNYLRLPPGTVQTPHTHPTLRVGLIVAGKGQCGTRHGLEDLSAGTVFVIPPGALHSFQSGLGELRIVIYHPDSDSGPTHTDHTMLNRTYIDGVSARELTELHTRPETTQ